MSGWRVLYAIGAIRACRAPNLSLRRKHIHLKNRFFLHTLFDSLWAVMRLQVIPEELGGAGRNRIEWEFDDAVFKEAA